MNVRRERTDVVHRGRAMALDSEEESSQGLGFEMELEIPGHESG